jgi:hypothetical protein
MAVSVDIIVSLGGFKRIPIILLLRLFYQYIFAELSKFVASVLSKMMIWNFP